MTRPASKGEKQHIRDYESDDQSQTQKWLQKICATGPIHVLVNVMVIVAVMTILLGVNNHDFELFCTIFFVVEVLVRIYANTPSKFFR
jgi:hypothetical protein